ncbi:MAG: hypothetical protein Sapg2KO_04270 [Saprospiraceae bacterium]
MSEESFLVQGVSIIWFSVLGIFICLLTLIIIVNKSTNSSSQGVCIVIDSYKLDSLPSAGKILFRNHCATCHNKNMVTDLTGPALAGTLERWAIYPKKDLYDKIRDSKKLREKGHPRALELWNTWKPNHMNAFPGLKEEEIDAIFTYVDAVYATSY